MKSRTVKKLYDSLEPKLGLETTETLVSFIDEKIVTEMDYRISLLVTKKDFWEAETASRERDNELAVRMEKGFADIESRFTVIEGKFVEIERRFTSIDNKFVEIERRFTVIEGKFGNIYKWMFVCWITQILAIFGFLKYFLP
ncbi:MAG: hypothetical protein SFU20_14265 [Chitinophagaceae bacterium]|nr:hypothetical protein [Chitinophagaceae bacterium]